MLAYQILGAAACALPCAMPAIGPALADYLTAAADLLAWHAADLPDPRDLARYASVLAASWWLSRPRRRTSR